VPSNDDPRTSPTRSQDPAAAIITLVADRRRFGSAILPALTGCAVRDQVSGQLTRVGTAREFARELDVSDQTIQFYRTFSNLQAALDTMPAKTAAVYASQTIDTCNSPDGLAASSSSDGGQAAVAVGIPQALPLDRIETMYEKASVRGGSPVFITTAAQRWSYAAAIPLILDRIPGSRRVVHIRARVLQGEIGVGILDGATNTFQRELFVGAWARPRDIYIAVPTPEAADRLIIRNASAAGVSAVEVYSTEVLAGGRSIDPAISLKTFRVADAQTSIHHDRAVRITMGPHKSAYAVTAPIRFHPGGSSILLRMRVRVLRGEVGWGLIGHDRRSLGTEERLGSTNAPVDVALFVPANAAQLVIRNAAADGTTSALVIEEAWSWQLN